MYLHKMDLLLVKMLYSKILDFYRTQVKHYEYRKRIFMLPPFLDSKMFRLLT